jgi:DNA repair exonuclease SbcCD ATPase subunit
MSIESDQIKKLRVRYLKCSKGDLHEGEVLNFICIDPACRNKGLICPVCQNTTHDGHHTLHLKLFLSEINKTLYNAEETSELSGLAEYLRSLDSSKREMIKSLREMVEQLAGKVREVEEKIEKGYCLLRKIILSQVNIAIIQSTVSMRLPELYRLLTQNDSTQDEDEIYRQIARYS